jgi:hypothetical protein
MGDDWIKRALTRRRSDRRGMAQVEEPDPKLVLGVKFLFTMLFCMVGLEVAHLVVLGKWNSEVFAGIATLTGTLTGLLVGQKT